MGWAQISRFRNKSEEEGLYLERCWARKEEEGCKKLRWEGGFYKGRLRLVSVGKQLLSECCCLRWICGRVFLVCHFVVDNMSCQTSLLQCERSLKVKLGQTDPTQATWMEPSGSDSYVLLWVTRTVQQGLSGRRFTAKWVLIVGTFRPVWRRHISISVYQVVRQVGRQWSNKICLCSEYLVRSTDVCGIKSILRLAF